LALRARSISRPSAASRSVHTSFSRSVSLPRASSSFFCFSSTALRAMSTASLCSSSCLVPGVLGLLVELLLGLLELLLGLGLRLARGRELLAGLRAHLDVGPHVRGQVFLDRGPHGAQRVLGLELLLDRGLQLVVERLVARLRRRGSGRLRPDWVLGRLGPESLDGLLDGSMR
jgi:hypothetical protein